MRDVEERKHEAYKYYDECLSDENNEADGSLKLVFHELDSLSGRRPIPKRARVAY